MTYVLFSRSVHIDVVIPTIGTISQCANYPNYQLAIQTEGMIRDIVRHLSEEVKYQTEYIVLYVEENV